MMTVESPPKRKRNSYQIGLANKLEENSAFISTLNVSMQARLNKVYSALSGNYSYIDSHTGKTVKARTYKKRLKFAEEEIEGLKSHLALQYKYGIFSEDKKSQIENYLGSLYSEAILKNSYLKNKNTRDSAVAKRVRSELHSLGPSIEDKLQIDENSRIMHAPTGYTPLFKEKERTISDDISEEQRKEESKVYFDPNDAKLPEGAPLVWPISLEEELKFKLKNTRKKKGLVGKLIGFAAMALVGVFLTYAPSSCSRKDTAKYSTISPTSQIANIDPDRLAEPAETIDYSGIDPDRPAVGFVDKATLDYESRLSAVEKKKPLTGIVSLSNPLTQLKVRNDLAWEKVRQYEEEIRSQKEREKVVSKIQQADLAKKINEMSSEKRKVSFDWRKSLDNYWQAKSNERAKQQIVSKTVTYYPGGKVIVTNHPNSATYASN